MTRNMEAAGGVTKRRKERKREKQETRVSAGAHTRVAAYAPLSYACARANCRHLSVPFEANPIIRNETASFHSLVQTHLFILRAASPDVDKRVRDDE